MRLARTAPTKNSGRYGQPPRWSQRGSRLGRSWRRRPVTWRTQLPLTSSKSDASTVGVGLRCSRRGRCGRRKIVDLDHRLLDDDHLAREVTRTQKAVREDAASAMADPNAGESALDITSSVGVPIVLAGKVWGALFVHSSGSPVLPADTAQRLSRFVDLVGFAVTNIRLQADMEQLIAEQAALLRVAELVARESAPEDVFHAVAEQLGWVTHVSNTQVLRFDDDEMATSVGAWGPVDGGLKLGLQISSRGNSVTGQVRATGLPARVEDYGSVEGEFGALMRGVGMRSAVGTPIRAAGRLWGVLVVGSSY